MKKFSFSLARLLDFKVSMLDKEKLSLASMRVVLRDLETQLYSINAQLEELSYKIKFSAQDGIAVFELKKLEYQIESSRLMINELKERIDEQKKLIDHQLNLVVTLKSEVSGLEKLRDKQREEYDYSVAKEETENIGELIGSQYARKSSQHKELDSKSHERR